MRTPFPFPISPVCRMYFAMKDDGMSAVASGLFANAEAASEVPLLALIMPVWNSEHELESSAETDAVNSGFASDAGGISQAGPGRMQFSNSRQRRQ